MNHSLERAACLALVLLLAGGCADKGKRASTEREPAPAATRAAAGTPTTTTTSRSRKVTEVAPAAKTVVVKAGTAVDGKLSTDLNSGKNKDGDTFSLTLAPGLFQDKKLKGAVLEGHVEGVKSAAALSKKGELDVMFDDLRLTNGVEVPVNAMLVSPPKARGTAMRNTLLVLGGAVAGHHIAKKLDKKHGALGGAAAGAAAALAMPGGQVVIDAGTSLKVKFTQDVVN